MFDSPPGFKPLPKYHLSLELQEKVQVPTECPSTKASQGVSDCGLIMPLVNPEASHRFEKDFNWLLSPELSIHASALGFLDLHLQFEGSDQTENMQADAGSPT